MKKYIAAVMQLDVQDNVDENLAAAGKQIAEAAARGAKLAVLPECMNYVGTEHYQEEIPGGKTFTYMAELAKKYNMWINAGSINETNPEEKNKPFNTAFLINPEGKLAAKYRKLHPSDMRFPGAVLESDSNSSGDKVVSYDTGDFGHLGLSICYDIRFSELYRLLTLQGANILMVSAMFMQQTGKDHWEPLLKARAIENGCYVLASDQIGTKNMGVSIPTYGRAMIVDPWGNVIARASDKPGVIYAEIDPDLIEEDRVKTSTLYNRRPDVYNLSIIDK